MKAHIYLDDAGGMVTGTHDVRAARRLMVDKYLEESRGICLPLESDDPEDRAEVAEVSRMFAAQKARLEVGRVVPAGPDHWEGYSWFWRSGYTLGKRGVTRAVVWNR